VLADEVGQHAAQLVQVHAAGLQHFGSRRVVEHREQKMLDGDELVLLLPRFDKAMWRETSSSCAIIEIAFHERARCPAKCGDCGPLRP
jgi:hypothetical protein